MAKRLPQVVVETKDRVAVAWAIGTTHHRYEDRYRLLSADIPLVASAGRGELFAVLDGIGGAPQGMRAAQTMADCLLRFYREPERYPATWEGVRDLLLEGNEEAFSWGFMEGTDRPLGGCAGTVVWVRGASVFSFHAGDTVGMLLNDRGFEVLTRLHETEGGIFRYFGKGASLEIDVAHHVLSDGDRVLLVSDGVTKVLDYRQMASLVQAHPDPESAVEGLARQAQVRGSPDDITVMVIEAEG
jgi:serine/threonine protein phosphatase PrpC